MTKHPRIDFNCDLGEGCGDDAAIMPFITSASIACGGHAGDDDSMRTTLRLCRQHGVAVGAHPAYPDRTGFGRRTLDLPLEDLAAAVDGQLRRLAALAVEEGVPLMHVKPHGALYNRAASDRDLADALVDVIAALDPGLRVFGLSGSQLVVAAKAAGLPMAHEVFAERGYGADARLLPRDQPGAVIASIEDTISQALGLTKDGRVTASDGSTLQLRADTLCLHGDRADAAAFARSLRSALEAEGVRVAAIPPGHIDEDDNRDISE